MVRSLMHKLIVEDSTECFTAMPDYVLIFKKGGLNETPVIHPQGLKYYAGSNPILPEMSEKYGTFEQLNQKYFNHKDPKTNKLSHIIWQRYASSVWDDIRIDNVLEYKQSKDEDDEKHVHPLQLDVIDRLVELYSNKNEIVFTPFMGVGSEVFSPVSMGRKAIGIELKDTYYKQAVKNLKTAKGDDYKKVDLQKEDGSIVEGVSAFKFKYPNQELLVENGEIMASVVIDGAYKNLVGVETKPASRGNNGAYKAQQIEKTMNHLHN